MLSRGNSNPMVCVANLLRLTRGEVPYERLKGIDASIIDKPADLVKPLLNADAVWNIKTYEPRVSVDSLDLDALIAVDGSFQLAAVLSGKEV